MLKLNVRLEGLDAIRKDLDNLRKQARFAAAVSLTKTAQAVAKDLEQEVGRTFDKPTPFIRRAFGITRATKDDLTATVFIKPIQAKTLMPHIIGGTRGQTRFEQRLAGETRIDGYWIPGKGVRLNQYGNMSRATIQQIAKSLHHSGKYRDIFIGTPKGHPGAAFGVWGRPVRGKGKGTLQLLLARVSTPRYRAGRFKFYAVAERSVEHNFARELDKAMAMAKATQR